MPVASADAGGAAGADRQRLEAEVHGRVQGVGFRYFVQRQAVRRKLSGYTRNLSDGRRVEVVAEGERAALEQFLADLRQGPPGSYVERVAASWLPATGTFAEFSIRH